MTNGERGPNGSKANCEPSKQLGFSDNLSEVSERPLSGPGGPGENKPSVSTLGPTDVGTESRQGRKSFAGTLSTTATLCVSGARPSGRFSVTSPKSGGRCSDAPALLVVKRRKRR